MAVAPVERARRTTRADSGATAPVSLVDAADPRRWQALWLVVIAAFMDILDASIVTLAVPFIQRDIGASFAQVQWVLAAYTLTFAATLITGGRLGDLFGRKRVFVLGIGGFTVASALCGLAPTPQALIAARVLQGAMAGVMVPQVLSILQTSFPPRERAAAFGAFGAVVGLGNVAGPIVAALLLQANLGGLEWRPIFLMNLPIGILTLVGVLVLVRESRAAQAARLDLGGVLLAAASLLLLLIPLVQGRDLGWPAWTFVAMLAAVPAFGLFAAYERRVGRRGGSPLVDPSLFRRRAFVAGLLVNLCVLAGIASFFLVYVVLAQVGLGFDALQTGLTALPWPLGIAVAAGGAVRLAPRVGRRLLSLGTLLMMLGMGGLIVALQAAGGSVSSWHLVPGLLVSGLGMGMVMPTLTDFVLAGVPERDSGSASGVLNTVMQVGSAAGVALIGVIFFGLLDPAVWQAADDVRQTMFASAATTTLWFEVGLFGLSFVLVRLLPERPVAHAS